MTTMYQADEPHHIYAWVSTSTQHKKLKCNSRGVEVIPSPVQSVQHVQQDGRGNEKGSDAVVDDERQEKKGGTYDVRDIEELRGGVCAVR